MSGSDEGRRQVPLEQLIRVLVREELAKLPKPQDGKTPVKGVDFFDGAQGAACDMAAVQRQVAGFLANLRIPVSEKAADGQNGWSPVLAVVADGERRVLQIAAWFGGDGAQPEAGMYVGAAGFVARAAEGADLRGQAGPRSEELAGGSDVGLKRLIQRVVGPTLTTAEIMALIEANTMEDFDQVPLDDQEAGSEDEVLTFTFAEAVHRVWVQLLAQSVDDTTVARVRTDGVDPDVDTGQPIDAGFPQPISALTSEVRVFTPSGYTVSVTGYRRRD